MTTLIIDEALRSKLDNLTETVQFQDKSGRVVGHFLPARCDPSPEPQISDEEIERRFRMGGGRPLSEIMADLEKRK